MVKIGDKIILSQSLIKELGIYIINGEVWTEQVCPALFKLQQVYNVRKPPSDAMVAGQFAETIHLGAGRGMGVTESMPLARGKKSTLQLRIEAHKERFTVRCEKHGIEVTNKNIQIPLIAMYDKDTYISGELDIFPTFVNGALSIVDFKYTGDVNNIHFSAHNMSTSVACWGKMDMFNRTQAVFYRWLVMNYNRELNIKWWEYTGVDYKRFIDYLDSVIDIAQQSGVEFFWFVIGGKKCVDLDEQYKLIHHKPLQYENPVFRNVVESGVKMLKDFEEFEYRPMYSQNSCNKCPMRDDCDEFVFQVYK